MQAEQLLQSLVRAQRDVKLARGARTGDAGLRNAAEARLNRAWKAAYDFIDRRTFELGHISGVRPVDGEQR